MPRKTISITIDEKLLKFIEKQVKNRVFSTRSHGIEYCVTVVQDTFRERVSEIEDELNKLDDTLIRPEIYRIARELVEDAKKEMRKDAEKENHNRP